jgi:Putative auto-transporter adhesin, head GIN domain
MKTHPCLFLSFLMILSLSVSAQENETTALEPFDKIVISPRINVVLLKGEQESIRIDYDNIPKDKLNYKVKGGKLKVYLDHARITEKQVSYYYHDENHDEHGKRGIYQGSAITIYVTYKKLRSIDLRGEEELRCDDVLAADKFKLKVYGEGKIKLASLEVKKFKTSLYGENNLDILSGNADHQVYRLFGENKIDTEGLKSHSASTRIYGEGYLSVNASDHFRINALGEPRVHVAGTSMISKGIILGRADIRIN